MKVCSVCNEIVAADQGCARSDCPNQIQATTDPAPKVDQGLTGKADRFVQAGLDGAGGVARETTRAAFFILGGVSAAILFALIFLMNNNEGQATSAWSGSGQTPAPSGGTEASPPLPSLSHSPKSQLTLGGENEGRRGAPLPPDPSFSNNVWTHNGSTVRLYASGINRAFYYEIPRDGLPVNAGQLLFFGYREGDAYSGVAYRFSSNCGAIAYDVSGKVEPNQTTINLSGFAPRRDEQCNQIGTFVDNLRFDLLHQ